MFCPKCGGKNDDDGRFCAQCGGTLPLKKTDEGRKARKRNIPVLAGIVICLAVLVAAGIGAIAYFDVDTSRIPIVSTLLPRLPFTKETRALFPVKVDGKYGYINDKGVIIIKPQFDEAYNFSEGRAVVGIGKRGYIDETGRMVIRPQYALVSNYREGLATVLDMEGNWSFIDKQGNIVVKMGEGTKGASSLSEGLAAVNIGGKLGFIDRKGKIVIAPQFDRIAPSSEMFGGGDLEPEDFVFSEGLACVAIGTKYGMIDKTGKFLIDPQYDGAYPFSQGLVAVQAGNKWGFIDKQGNTAIPFRFNSVRSFSEGLASVSTEGKRGFIDKQGNMIIAPQYDMAHRFSEGLASACIGRSCGL